ncbi:MAG: anhydro-N-acetylmuramic acid kinase [Rhodocyclaceae bacterium]
MATRPALYIGLMSGTSMDGVDGALCDLGASLPRPLASHHLSYPDRLRHELLSLREPGEDELHRAALLSAELAELYAECVEALLSGARIPASRIAAIGCHGQTIRHRPEMHYSVQLDNPALLAERTGITVVANFRARDLAAGGQGAPLVPAFHDAVFRLPNRHRVVLNLGGIANLTDLAPGHATCGFDCGPGNTLMDAWIESIRGLRFDENGDFAASGKPIERLLAAMMSHPYLALPPPKSCGQEQFNPDWVKALLEGDERPEDVQATLLEFTATGVTRAIGRWCGAPDEVLVCGGGSRNGALVTRLAALLPGVRLRVTDDLGLAATQVEACAFAWLAMRATNGLPGNLPEVTGACAPRVLGAIHPA